MDFIFYNQENSCHYELAADFWLLDGWRCCLAIRHAPAFSAEQPHFLAFFCRVAGVLPKITQFPSIFFIFQLAWMLQSYIQVT
ncbi:hypothetical protein [Herminiimonas fonticola]|uniref:hypothetical protein n=1 Tax=Herminiimonas fonticola TaxID=303380 RepID=UPI003341AE93